MGPIPSSPISNREVKELNVLFWWFNARVTPLPIPNREVKPGSGDDSLNGESS